MGYFSLLLLLLLILLLILILVLIILLLVESMFLSLVSLDKGPTVSIAFPHYPRYRPSFRAPQLIRIPLRCYMCSAELRSECEDALRQSVKSSEAYNPPSE